MSGVVILAIEVAPLAMSSSLDAADVPALTAPPTADFAPNDIKLAGSVGNSNKNPATSPKV